MLRHLIPYRTANMRQSALIGLAANRTPEAFRSPRKNRPKRVDRSAFFDESLRMLARTAALPDDRRQVMIGVGLAALGYSLFAIQDAIVKWLVTSFSVPEILFVRSIIITLVAIVLSGRDIGRLVRSPFKMRLFVRTVLMFAAWLLFYSAARHLGLAEMTTLYFAAPIIVVALARPILGERAGAAHWAAVVVGFVGVVLAARPSGSLSPVAAGMALAAAACWAGSVLLLRSMAREETTANVMLFSNALFAIGSGALAPFAWVKPSGAEMALMLGLGLIAALGQFLLFRGFRDAPAAVLAPVEYTGLIWAFLYGYLIWRDVPGLPVFLGAILIASSTIGLVWYENMRGAGVSAAIVPARVPRS
jgi:S-adenosylmethionine uptake transporter